MTSHKKNHYVSHLKKCHNIENSDIADIIKKVKDQQVKEFCTICQEWVVKLNTRHVVESRTHELKALSLKALENSCLQGKVWDKSNWTEEINSSSKTALDPGENISESSKEKNILARPTGNMTDTTYIHQSNVRGLKRIWSQENKTFCFFPLGPLLMK